MINNQFAGIVPDDIARRIQEGDNAAQDMQKLYICMGDEDADPEKLRDFFEPIYRTLPLFDRQRVKDDLCKLPLMRKAGVTRFALDLIDRNEARTDKRTRIKEALEDFVKIAEGGNIEALQKNFSDLQRAVYSDNYNGFEAQLHTTPETIAAATASRGDYLATTWNLYTEERGQYVASRPVSFAPSSVSFVAAPTSHGKTAFLLATAMQFARAAKGTNKVYLYVSIEEDTEKLYIRCYNSEINTRFYPGRSPRVDNKKVIRDHLRAQDLPGEYADTIEAGMKRFWNDVAPNLKLVNADTDIEKLCCNIEAVALDLDAQGLQLGGVFLDYLQLMSAEGHFSLRTDEMKAICYRMKVCAEAIRVPFVCAAQLNRDASKKAEYLNGVNLTNLGESSEIEKIANDVFLLWQVDKIEADQLGTGGRKGRIKRVTQEFSDKDIRVVRNPNSGNGFLYLECLKARDFETGGCCLIEWNAQTGHLYPDSVEPFDDLDQD